MVVSVPHAPWLTPATASVTPLLIQDQLKVISLRLLSSTSTPICEIGRFHFHFPLLVFRLLQPFPSSHFHDSKQVVKTNRGRHLQTAAPGAKAKALNSCHDVLYKSRSESWLPLSEALVVTLELPTLESIGWISVDIDIGATDVVILFIIVQGLPFLFLNLRVWVSP